MHRFNSKKLRCGLALALVICMAAVLAVSVAYGAAHVGHIHDSDAPGGECLVCANVHSTAMALRCLTTALGVGAAFSFIALLRLEYKGKVRDWDTAEASPLSAVRLDI
ncbi:MAG: hypothetical protein LBR73_09170 [Oscillospiraceae bacterium]|jgi:hypothetical protein|nr:hypothetical protein [Oscillospiraceae bacterium]